MALSQKGADSSLDPTTRQDSGGYVCGFPSAQMVGLKNYLTDVVGIPKDLLTTKCIDMILRNRARNFMRGRYTIGGYIQDDFEDLDPVDTISMLRALIDSYRTPVKEMVNDLDIFQLPAFALMTEELTEMVLECFDTAGELVGVDLDESTESIGDVERNKLIEATKLVFIECSQERNGVFQLDIEDFFMCLKIFKERRINLDIRYNEEYNLTAPENKEVIVLFASVVGDGDHNHIGLDQWVQFIVKQHLYANWTNRDPPVEFTLFSNMEFLVVFNIYWFYFIIVVSQMVLPVILMLDWSTGALGDADDHWEFRQILLDDSKSPFLSLCTNEAETSFKFAVACVFSFLILLTDVGNAVINMERRVWGKPLQFTPVLNDEEDASTTPYMIMRHSPMAADPVFFQLGDFWNLTCYCLIVIATYVLMQASGSLDNVLKDIIAVNFLVELDNLVCEVVLTDTHLEYIEAKLLPAYIMYGENSNEEVENLTHGDSCLLTIRKFFLMWIDNVMAPVLLISYYMMYTTPLLTFFCF